jgi:flagellar basal body-associated protein FliL
MAKGNKKTEIDLLEIDPSQEAAGRKGGVDDLQATDVSGRKPSSWLKRFAFIIYILAGMLIFSGGIMGAMLLGWIQISSPPHESAGLKGIPGKAANPPDKPPEMGPTLKLSSLVINLNEPSGFHFVKAAVVLELGKAVDLEKIKERTAPLTDTVILTLGDQHLTDLMNPEYREKLKKELLARMNQRLQTQKIKKLYFDEFIYQ